MQLLAELVRTFGERKVEVGDSTDIVGTPRDPQKLPSDMEVWMVVGLLCSVANRVRERERAGEVWKGKFSCELGFFDAPARMRAPPSLELWLAHEAHELGGIVCLYGLHFDRGNFRRRPVSI